MSLLQKASIITTPTAYAEDYLYSIKPAYALGSELVTNGNFSDGTNNWIIDDASNGSISVVNNKLQITSNGGTGYPVVKQGVSTRIGITYQISLEMSLNTAGFWLRVSQFLSHLSGDVTYYANDKTSSINVLGEFTAIATTTYIKIFAEQNDAGSFFIDNVSVKEITDADFDFTRNSTGTRVNEDYLIEDVPYNLVSYSEDLSQFTKINATVTTNQTLAPNGTLTADKIVFNGTANARVEQNLTASIMGTPNTQSVFLKTESGTANIDIGLATHDVTTVAVTSEWKRFTHTGVGNFPRMKSDSAATIFAWGFQVVAGSNNKPYLKTTDRLDIPRIDYTNGEPSILLEPSRQNLVTSSTDYSNSAWSKNNLTVTLNSAISPEGIMNASLLVENSSNAQRFIGDSLSLSSGTTYSVSIYAKKKERSVLQISPSSSHIAASYANYDLDSGVVSATGGSVTAEIQSLDNDWYRCILTFTVSLTATATLALFIQTSTTAARGASYQGNGSSGLYLYGAQVEAGSYETSLIHTSGSSVTRSADAANNAGNSDLFNDSEGVLYIETQALVDEADAKFISVDAGNGQNRVILGYPGSASSRITGYLQSSAGGGMTGNIDNIDTTEKHKIAFKYKSNDCSIFIDGVKRLQNDSVTMPVGLNTLNFTNGIANSGTYKGNLNSIMVFKEALTDLELEKLTGYNNHELYMNYYNRLSYLGLAEEYNVESDINNYIL